MRHDPEPEYLSADEAEQRTRAIVRAAAKTPPVPLKAIPKKTGGKRKLKGSKNMPAIGDA